MFERTQNFLLHLCHLILHLLFELFHQLLLIAVQLASGVLFTKLLQESADLLLAPVAKPTLRNQFDDCFFGLVLT